MRLRDLIDELSRLAVDLGDEVDVQITLDGRLIEYPQIIMVDWDEDDSKVVINAERE
jgi:hypothetical protein